MAAPPLQVTFLLFALARERAGVDRVELSLPPGSRVIDALKALASRHPALDDVIQRSRVAMNGEFCAPEAEIAPAAELALIPPVSGG